MEMDSLKTVTLVAVITGVCILLAVIVGGYFWLVVNSFRLDIKEEQEDKVVPVEEEGAEAEAEDE